MTPRLKISRAGLELIKGFEGYRRRAVRMADGQWTVGYGHIKSARDGSDVTPEDAEALLLYDLQEVEIAINDGVLAPLTQHQYDALVSFAFNIGLDNFRRSAVLRRLNEGRVLQAACAMELWRKARVDGEDIVVDALVRRRATEKSLFLTPPGGSVAAPSSEIRPEPDFSVQAAVPRETPRLLDLGLDDVSLADHNDDVIEEIIPTQAAPVVQAERAHQAYPMELTDRPVISAAMVTNVVAFPDNHEPVHHHAVAAAHSAPRISSGAAVLEAERPVALPADVPQTSPEEILDIVRRIREMTESAPAPTAARTVAVETISAPTPAAEAVPVVQQGLADVLVDERPLVSVPLAADLPVVETAPAGVADDPFGKPMGGEVVASMSFADMAQAAPPAPAVPVFKRDPSIDPSTVVIPEEGLTEALYSGEEVFDIGMVHEAPPSTGKDSTAIFMGDSKSIYQVVMGVLGLVAVILGFLGLGAENATFMSGAFPLILGVLMMAGSGFLIFTQYQKYLLAKPA